MKKIKGKISKLKGRQSEGNFDALIKTTKPNYTKMFTYDTDDKSVILDTIDEPLKFSESGESNINKTNHKTSSQKDSRQGTNVFLIENYAELHIMCRLYPNIYPLV